MPYKDFPLLTKREYRAYYALVVHNSHTDGKMFAKACKEYLPEVLQLVERLGKGLPIIQQPMIESIFEYEERNRGNGYGVALVNPEGQILTPYIDPSDYPDLEVATSPLHSNGRGVGKYAAFILLLHSGVGEDWYHKNINYYTEEPNEGTGAKVHP